MFGEEDDEDYFDLQHTDFEALDITTNADLIIDSPERSKAVLELAHAKEEIISMKVKIERQVRKGQDLRTFKDVLDLIFVNSPWTHTMKRRIDEGFLENKIHAQALNALGLLMVDQNLRCYFLTKTT
jgi:ABC-type enterochelin transport system substrate-binding protein